MNVDIVGMQTNDDTVRPLSPRPVDDTNQPPAYVRPLQLDKAHRSACSSLHPRDPRWNCKITCMRASQLPLDALTNPLRARQPAARRAKSACEPRQPTWPPLEASAMSPGATPS